MTDEIEKNPLVGPSPLPYGAPPFADIRPAHFLPALGWAIAEARARLDALKNNPAPPTFENTVEALVFYDEALGRVSSAFSYFAGVHKTPELKAIQEEFESRLVEFSSDVSLDPVLFARVRAVYDARAGLGLDTEGAKLLDDTYRGFVRSGALLNDADKARLRRIDQDLTKITTQYDDNVTASEDAWKRLVTDKAELEGVPPRALDIYRDLAAKAGHAEGWLITISPPPSDISSYARNRALREEIYRAQCQVAYAAPYDNRPAVPEIVRLRDEKARLLGYDGYAPYALDGAMAESVKTVGAFLDRNLSVYYPAAEKELADLKDYARRTDGLTDFQPWDYAYYWHRAMEEKFGLDLETLRPYFELNRVLNGLNAHAEKLFDIKIAAADGAYPVYDPAVRVFEVRDNRAGGAVIGLFYGDYYARPGFKQPGAWMNLYRARGLYDGQDAIPIVANNMNVPRPPEGKPALISLDEVRTLFHEFGHALHGLLAVGRYPCLTGTNVEQDFVELPSQVQENWALEKEVLDTFAVHHETGEKLPAELIAKVKEADNFGAAYAGLRQTALGLLDFRWHTGPVLTVEDVEDEVSARAALFPRIAGAMSPRFGHLFGSPTGYAVGYYGYKWAEVLDADVFAAFKAKGLYDRELGDRLRDTIYAPGGTRHPAELYRAMMGRDPDPDALFRREGLTSYSNSALRRPAARPSRYSAPGP